MNTVYVYDLSYFLFSYIAYSLYMRIKKKLKFGKLRNNHR